MEYFNRIKINNLRTIFLICIKILLQFFLPQSKDVGDSMFFNFFYQKITRTKSKKHKRFDFYLK